MLLPATEQADLVRTDRSADDCSQIQNGTGRLEFSHFTDANEAWAVQIRGVFAFVLVYTEDPWDCPASGFLSCNYVRSRNIIITNIRV